MNLIVKINAKQGRSWFDCTGCNPHSNDRQASPNPEVPSCVFAHQAFVVIPITMCEVCTNTRRSKL